MSIKYGSDRAAQINAEGLTNSQHLSNSSLPPFDEVTTFAAAHIEDFPMFFSWTSGWPSSGEGWMTELRNKDRFHPVVEILESDDGRLLALFYAHLWTQIVCEGGVNGRLSGWGNRRLQ
jgi:hypothetical protein